MSTLFAYGLWDLPGPALAKVSNLWRLIEAWKGHQELGLLELHRKHGKIVQVGPEVVSIADPDAIETIYGIKADLPKVIRRSATENKKISRMANILFWIGQFLQTHAKLSQWQNHTYTYNVYRPKHP